MMTQMKAEPKTQKFLVCWIIPIDAASREDAERIGYIEMTRPEIYPTNLVVMTEQEAIPLVDRTASRES
jgi:hypothetical protein